MSPGYRLTDDEALMLEVVIAHNLYPNRATRQELADKLAVSEKKVSIWFAHKRSKIKYEKTPSELLQRKPLLRTHPNTCT